MSSNFVKVFLFCLFIVSVTISACAENVVGHEGDFQRIRRPTPTTRLPITTPLSSFGRLTQIALSEQQITPVVKTSLRSLDTRTVERGSKDEEGTLNLIRQGDSDIKLLPTHRDLVLMLGNTGAGKTTISKVLTTENDLESYWDSRGRFLIRDRENKIGSSSTVISKTIFPELFIDAETGTAFYDLPGFSDTRNSSVELANAYFIKKVADHAHTVKLVFIVNYSSLRPGENRIDFMILIRHAISLIPDTKKFEDGIVLVASKVETSMPFDRIISGIAGFLNQVIIDLPNIIQDDEELDNAINLVSAMTIRSEDGTGYPRIGLFGFVDQEGPLNEIPKVQSAKELLQEIIYDNTEYVQKSTQDFHFPVSAEMKLLSRSLILIINQRILNSTAQLHELIVGAYMFSNGQNKSQSCNTFIEISKDIEIVKNETMVLNGCERKVEFLTHFNQTLRLLRINKTKSETLFKEYERNLENLQFFQTISEKSSHTGSIKPSEWLSPLKLTQESLTQQSDKAIQDLNEDICNRTYVVGEEYSQLIQGKLNIHPNLTELRIELQSDLNNFYSIKRLILNKQTCLPNKFGAELMELMGNMNVAFPPGFLSSQFTSICYGLIHGYSSDTIKSKLDSKSMHFTPMLWVAPFERFVPFLNGVINSLSIMINNAEHSQMIKSQNKTIQGLENGIQRLSTEGLRNMTALKKAQEESVQNYTRHINQLSRNAKEMERNRTVEMNKWAKRREDDQKKWENKIKETERVLQAKQEADKIAFERERDSFSRKAAEQRANDRREFESKIRNLENAVQTQPPPKEESSEKRCFYTNCHDYLIGLGSGCPNWMETRSRHYCLGVFGIYEECCTK